MDWRRRFSLMILIMTVVSLSVIGITLFVLYETAFEHSRERLEVLVRSQARLIQAVARFEAARSTAEHPGGARAATLSQIIDSYRLTPETGERLLGQFAEEAAELHASGVRFAFGGTPPVAERVQPLGFFEKIFDGSESPEQVLAYLKGQKMKDLTEADFPQRAIDRIEWRQPYPILRHHFGLPSMQDTIEGIQKIAEAQALDLISLGTDQDAQENFFHPERHDPRRTGAGGVPVRTPYDFLKLYEASRCGNFPMLRAYSGTDDFIRYAEVLTETSCAKSSIE